MGKTVRWRYPAKARGRWVLHGGQPRARHSLANGPYAGLGPRRSQRRCQEMLLKVCVCFLLCRVGCAPSLTLTLVGWAVQAVAMQHEQCRLVLDAHQIWATQATIEPLFGVPCGNADQQQPTALTDTLQQLQQGLLQAADLPPIRVVLKDGRYYSLDNRRLYLFHQLPAPCEVPVLVCPQTKEFFQKLTASGNTKTPRLRRPPPSYASAAGATPDTVTGGPVSSRYTYQGTPPVLPCVRKLHRLCAVLCRINSPCRRHPTLGDGTACSWSRPACW